MVRVRRIFHRRIPVPGMLPFTVSGYIEVGAYELVGTGTAEIRFIGSYSSTPAVIKEGLGYIELLGVKIPVPLFVTSIDNRRIRLFNIGRNVFTFIAVGQ